jgi:hypothetical protein
MSNEFKDTDILHASLIIDAIYKGNASSAGGFDSLPSLLGCGNLGGFRKVGSAKSGYKYIIFFIKRSRLAGFNRLL